MNATLLQTPSASASDLSVFDEFSGCGGTMDGAARVPYTRGLLAVNHKPIAIASHAANFPGMDHDTSDVQSKPIEAFPYAHIFLSSPACPPWTDARGKKRDFDKSNQQVLFGEAGPDETTMRNRLLMEEVPRYLRYWAGRGRPVLAGMMENVIQCRRWDQFDRWIREIRECDQVGYDVRVIAFNSMHAQGTRSHTAPQSRDRLYVGWVHRSVGRTPDWDKWLRPLAPCATCGETVQAIQVFKRPGNDMGRYGQQYVYRCPKISCRNRVVEPAALPASAAIDWSIPGIRIGDRADLGMEPLKPNTIARIKAGIAKYWAPLLAPAGGTWRTAATPLGAPMPARTTRETDGLAVPALMVPVEGRPGKTAASAEAPLRTQTARTETGIASLPAFQVSLRGGGCKDEARPIDTPLGTVTASGNHHGLVAPLVMRNNTPRGDLAQMCTPVDEPLRTFTSAGHQSLLVPYYGNGTARATTEPAGTFPTRHRWALADGAAIDPASIDVDDVRFRMLEPEEIRRAMAFRDGYIVLGNKREKVAQLGNAVTPPVSELIVSALVEAITGEQLDRYPAA